MDNNPFSTEWMSGWNELQRKIWDDWSEVTQSSWAKNFQNESPIDFFQESMNRWTGMFSKAPAPETMAMRNALSSMEGFMRMGREVFKAFQGLPDGASAGREWTSQLDQIIQNAKKMMSGAGGGFAGGMNAMNAMNPMNAMNSMKNMEDLSAFWSRPMKAWSDFLTTNPGFSNDTFRAMLSGGQNAEEMMSRFLSMPGLGFNREKQEKIQEGMRLSLEYHKAMEEFQGLMNKSNTRALDLLHRKLLEMGAEGKPLETMRDLYVLWVDCSEEANAESVTSKEFNDVNARMMNALVRVRRHMGEMIDSALSALNMPTRRELDSAHSQIATLKRRIQSLEDEVRELRTKDASSDINALRDDMEKLGVRRLKEELSDLKRQLEESLLAAPVETATTEKQAAIRKTTPVRIGGGKPPVSGGSVQKGE